MGLPKFFRIAVYGLLWQDNYLLFAREKIQGREVVKFPGGGMQLGEGTIEALKREFMEELNIEVEVLQHIYTTDFFVPSAFHSDYQVLAIYYLLRSAEVLPSEDFQRDGIHFFWQSLSEVHQNILTFETDKRALEMLLKSKIK